MNADFATRSRLPAYVFFNHYSMLAFLLALLGLVRISREMALHGFARIAFCFGGALVASLVVMGFFHLGIRIWAKLATRREFRDNPSLLPDEAEKFYYLALWGALHKNVKFSRRMLKHAVSHGFKDKARLADPLLATALPCAARRLLGS